MTDDKIVEIWQGLGGGEGYLKSFGFIQFARAVMAEQEKASYGEERVIDAVAQVVENDGLDEGFRVVASLFAKIGTAYRSGTEGGQTQSFAVQLDGEDGVHIVELHPVVPYSAVGETLQ